MEKGGKKIELSFPSNIITSSRSSAFLFLVLASSLLLLTSKHLFSLISKKTSLEQHNNIITRTKLLGFNIKGNDTSNLLFFLTANFTNKKINRYGNTFI